MREFPEYQKRLENKTLPLISVIIPCYNQANYLRCAIKSVLKQTYPCVEILVIDDGSIDNCAEVAADFPEARYIYQINQGLSAARNTGINNCKGDYVAFLDADDYFLEEALESNANYLLHFADIAFVSGSYLNKLDNEQFSYPDFLKVDSNHYLHFLQYNFIGMIAAVLFQRWVFSEFSFDTKLKGSEDHEIYLKVTRKYKVIHHSEKIAVYRRHEYNMSNNIPMMVANALVVLKRQKKILVTKAEKNAFNSSYRSLYKQFFSVNGKKNSNNINILKEDLYFFYKYKCISIHNQLINKIRMSKPKIINKIPSFILKKLYQKGWLFNPNPAVGQVQGGHLNRLTPLSKAFGFDRGGAIDRYYIENFLKSEAFAIRGRVLEIGDNSYTITFGEERVIKSDILHVDETNKAATFIGDISDAPHIPDNTFDCLIFTQTLHLIYNFKEALQTCHRILKPGGALLLTVPGITPIDHDEWKDTWYWSFTHQAMDKLMAETFPGGELIINDYGNVSVATSFLYGMGLPELAKEKLDFHDPHYQVIITVKAVKK